MILPDGVNKPTPCGDSTLIAGRPCLSVKRSRVAPLSLQTFLAACVYCTSVMSGACLSLWYLSESFQLPKSRAAHRIGRLLDDRIGRGVDHVLDNNELARVLAALTGGAPTWSRLVETFDIAGLDCNFVYEEPKARPSLRRQSLRSDPLFESLVQLLHRRHAAEAFDSLKGDADLLVARKPCLVTGDVLDRLLHPAPLRSFAPMIGGVIASRGRYRRTRYSLPPNVHALGPTQAGLTHVRRSPCGSNLRQ